MGFCPNVGFKKRTHICLMKVLSGFMRNEAKQAQSKGTLMTVLSFPWCSEFPRWKFISSYCGTGTLPHPQTSSVHFLPLTLEGLLTPQTMEYNKVITHTFWGKVIHWTQVLPGSHWCVLSLSFSPALTLTQSEKEPPLWEEPQSTWETTWMYPSWQCQLRCQPTASIKPRFMGE